MITSVINAYKLWLENWNNLSCGQEVLNKIQIDALVCNGMRRPFELLKTERKFLITSHCQASLYKFYFNEKPPFPQCDEISKLFCSIWTRNSDVVTL